MLNLVPPTDCLRAREAASAQLDGELSELGAARLAAHLRTCADCRSYVVGLRTTAGVLRAAPLELPETPIALPPLRRRAGGLRVAAAAAAAVAVAAGSSFALGRALGTQGTSTAAPTGIPGTDLTSLRADNTQQHILAMVRRLQPHGTLRIGNVMAL